MTQARTHYDHLKITPDAPPELVRAAYRHLSQKYHPDKNPHDPQATWIMGTINAAYAVLSDPDKRQAYDLWLAGQQPQSPPPKKESGTAWTAPSPASPPPVKAARGFWENPALRRTFMVLFALHWLGTRLIPEWLWLWLRGWLVSLAALYLAALFFGVPHLRFEYQYYGSRQYPIFTACTYLGPFGFVKLKPGVDIHEQCPVIGFLPLHGKKP